jgi:hypothetical protein
VCQKVALRDQIDSRHPLDHDSTSLAQREEEVVGHAETIQRWGLAFLRWGLPVIVTTGGLIVMCLGGENNLEGGASIMGVGPAIWAINWLYRASFDGDVERDREDEAREYLDRHGHWPDQAPSQPGQARDSGR